MVKKVIITTILFSVIFLSNNVLAQEDIYYHPDTWVYDNTPSVGAIKQWYEQESNRYNNALNAANAGKRVDDNGNVEWEWTSSSTSDSDFSKADYDQLRSQGLSDSEAKKQSWYNGPSTEQQAEAARNAECATSWDCIDKTSFTIDTSLFSVGGNGLKWGSSKETINNMLGTLIQKLMIALWVIALLVMSIWAWYMIMYHWQDEYLSKWKNIFMWGVTALIVALCSYYLVNLVGYILYK